MRRRTLAAALLAVAGAGAVAAYARTVQANPPPPPPPPPGTPVAVLTLTVTDGSNGQPVAKAKVILAGVSAGPSGYTDGTGTWVSPVIPQGSYLLTVTAAGYETYQNEIALSQSTVSLPVSLTPTPTSPGPYAMTFVSFEPSAGGAYATWKNGTSAPIDCVCYVTAKNSAGQTVAIGSSELTVQPGESTTFPVVWNAGPIPYGAYLFATFCWTPYGVPISKAHTETDVV